MPKSKVRKKNDFTVKPVSRTPVKIKAGPSSAWFVALFIGLMALTSFDGAVRWLGARSWRLLHLGGIYFLWLSFLFTFGKRIPMSGGYALPVIVLLAALALRLWPQRRRKPPEAMDAAF